MYLSRNRCYRGLLVNGGDVLGGEEVAVYLPSVQVPPKLLDLAPAPLDLQRPA